MKARITCTKQQRKAIEQEAAAICAKEIERQRDDLTRRLFKLMLVSLHKEFKFGHDRLVKALGAMTRLVEKSDTDEVFWEHCDRLLIDYYKLPFDRDYTDNGKVRSENK